jgi:hypothetical protein
LVLPEYLFLSEISGSRFFQKIFFGDYFLDYKHDKWIYRKSACWLFLNQKYKISDKNQ